jgi:hypothetical protein
MPYKKQNSFEMRKSHEKKNKQTRVEMTLFKDFA